MIEKKVGNVDSTSWLQKMFERLIRQNFQKMGYFMADQTPLYISNLIWNIYTPIENYKMVDDTLLLMTNSGTTLCSYSSFSLRISASMIPKMALPSHALIYGFLELLPLKLNGVFANSQDQQSASCGQQSDSDTLLTHSWWYYMPSAGQALQLFQGSVPMRLKDLHHSDKCGNEHFLNCLI